MEPIDITNNGTALLLLVFLGCAVLTDLARRQIPNLLVAAMLGCGIIFQTALLGKSGFLLSLGGIVVGFSILVPFYALGGLGAGDVKLLAGVGGFLDPWGVAVVGVSTLLVGGVIGVLVVLWQRVGKVLAARYLSIPPSASMEEAVKIPYSLAIAAGTVAAFY